MTTLPVNHERWRVPFMRPDLPEYAEVAGAITAAFSAGMLTKGDQLRGFESDASAMIGTSEAVGVSSCTSGLMLVLGALRRLATVAKSCAAAGGCAGAASAGDHRDEVIVPSFIFLAAPASILWAGYRPVFVEVNPETFTIDPHAVRAALSPRTAAVLGCHTFGCPCDVEELASITTAAGVPLIIDAAHGFGASRRGRPVGAGALAQVFSLSPTKLVVAGEGGLVATSCSCLADLIRIGREYGNDGRYGCDAAGLNGRLPEVSAIIGRASLGRLPEVAEKRREASRAYVDALEGVPGVGFQSIPADCQSSWKDFCISINEREAKLTRNDLMGALAARGIDTRAYYSPACHQMRAFAEYFGDRPPLSITDRLAASLLALPMGAHVTCEVAREVAAQVREAVLESQEARHARSR
jgi:dTDP-4-amino-4,6-dideoxygalactose transaminase